MDDDGVDDNGNKDGVMTMVILGGRKKVKMYIKLLIMLNLNESDHVADGV